MKFESCLKFLPIFEIDDVISIELVRVNLCGVVSYGIRCLVNFDVLCMVFNYFSRQLSGPS